MGVPENLVMTGLKIWERIFIIGSYHQISLGIRYVLINSEPSSNPNLQVSSYGGFLEFTLRYVPRPGAEEPSDKEALVELNVRDHNIS